MSKYPEGDMGARSQEFGSSYAVSPEALLLLPLSRGYGSLSSLHIAAGAEANDNNPTTLLRVA